MFDDSFIAQRKLFIYYCGVEALLFGVEVKSVKNPEKLVKNTIVTYTFSYTRDLGTRK